MGVERQGIRGFFVGFAVTVAAAAVVLAAWFAITGLQAKAAVGEMERSLAAAKSAVASGELAAAAEQLPRVAEEAAQVSGIMGGAPWSWLGQTGSLGATASSVATIAGAADSALAPLVGGGTVQSAAAQVARGGNPASAMDALAAAQPQLARAASAAVASRLDVAAIDPAEAVGSLQAQVAAAQQQYLELTDGLSALQGAAESLPTILGADGPRNWLVLLQNEAEPRGTGGIIGAYSIARVRSGKVQPLTSDSNNSLSDRMSLAGIPTDTRALWGDDLSYVWGMNLDRHFPYFAKLAQRTLPAGSPRIDEVLSLDVHAVAALMRLTGPLSAEGVTVAPEEAVDYLSSGIYEQFPNAEEKDEVLVSLLENMLDRLGTQRLDWAQLWQVLGPVAGEQRLMLFSNDPAVQSGLELMPSAGTVPETDAPWATVAVNDFAGLKTGGFLEAEASYNSSAGCAVEGSYSTIEVRITNKTPGSLSGYGTTRNDRWGGPAGSTKVELAVYGPAGAQPVEFLVDGEAGAAAMPGTSRSRPVWKRPLDIERGETRTFTVRFEEPFRPYVDPVLVPQPMVRPMQVSVSEDTACSN